MDEYSWNRRYNLLSFDADAGIRSAIKTQYSIDDEYGAGGEDFGLEYWFFRFKPMYWIKTRKKSSRYAEAHQARVRKRQKGSKPLSFYEMFGLPEPDDDD